MPDHTVHQNVDHLIFGVGFPDVHDLIDLPAKDQGPNHRKILHDYDTIAGFILANKPLEAWAAYYHIVLDLVADRVGKDRCIRELLVLMRDGEVAQLDLTRVPPALKRNY